MRVSDFDFVLPEDRIALEPARPRDTARLLHVSLDGFHDRIVRDLPELLLPGDLLVLNDTKVIPAQLYGSRSRSGTASRPEEQVNSNISATLIRRLDDARWLALAKPGKRLKAGDRLHFGSRNPACDAGKLDAVLEEKRDNGEVVLRFDLAGAVLDQTLALIGEAPLPPYIRRFVRDDDKRDYQTVYAKEDGAVAAPTAGLHFTDELFALLDARGVRRAFVTLHVGAGTFLPVKADDTKDHVMHSEWGEITAAEADAINAARAAGGRIVAVGTTSLRILESAADEDGKVRPFRGETSIFITPGYRFKAVDVLMTNFHLPRSTLFMLVCAFAGTERMKAAYAHAIDAKYRFYSYGDACLMEGE
jgi:S-adenosylmethionine:tRNA ribosyltransferase-isomerase